MIDSSLQLGRLDVSAYTVPTSAPEGDGTLAWDATTIVLVQAVAGSWTGIGWTFAPGACAALIKETLEPAVTGLNPFDVPAAAEAMARAVRNTPRPGLAGYAISAVDCALWDLKARILGLPLHRLLGAARAEVEIYGSGGFTTYSEAQLRRQLEGWTGQQQIPRVKIKIGEDRGANTARDLLRIRQARDTIGPHVQLFVDANGAYTAKQAVRVLNVLEKAHAKHLNPTATSCRISFRRCGDATAWTLISAGKPHDSVACRTRQDQEGTLR